MTSKYNLRSVCRAAIVFRIASTAKPHTSALITQPTEPQKRTFPQRSLILRNVRVRPNRLVLSVHKHPETDMRLGEMQSLRDDRLERGVGVGFEHAEGGKVVRCGSVLVLKGCEIETLVVAEGFVGDNLERRLVMDLE